MPDRVVDSETSSSPELGSSRCGHCGKAAVSPDTASLGLFSVCIQCKPVVEQKLRENLIHPELFWNALPYADFGTRAMAKIFDWLFQYIIMIPTTILFMKFLPDSSPWVAIGINSLVNLLIGLNYQVITISRYSATPGKMMLNLEIVTQSGGRVTGKRAFGRFWAEMLSSSMFSIGYLMAVGDEEARTLHDRLAGTRVVQKQALKRKEP